MKAVIDLAAFLELSDDDVVDPDAAVEQLEILAFNLKHLTQEERQVFIHFISKTVADLETKELSNDNLVSFLRSLPDSLGLIE
jgi:hypothetical protein